MTIIPFVLKLPTKTKNKFSLNNVVHLSLLIKFLVPLILDSVSLVALNMLDSTLWVPELNVLPLVNTLLPLLPLKKNLVMILMMILMNNSKKKKMLMSLEITMKLMKEPPMKPPLKKLLKLPMM
jgi:hypothetical protein